jgi:hypothetical protein
MGKARGREAVLVALATLALAVVLYPGALLRGEAFFERDLHVDWYPRAAALLRCLHAGAWPLWDPGLGFGQPLLADPSLQALYPPTWLALALPWRAAYTAFVLANLFLAALGAKRLAARLGAGRAGSWTAALAFALSGPMQSSLNLWTHFAGAATMPWVLLAFDTAARRPAVGSALALGIALALQLLAGSPDVCAATYALGLGLVGFRLVGTRARRRDASLLGRRLASLAAGAALAGALTCAVWWPTAQAVQRSTRRALPEEVRTAWSVPAAGLSRIAAPLDPARVPFEPGRWTQLYDRPVQPLLYSLYLGMPALGLGCAAFFARRRRWLALALAGAAVLLVVFAMGPHGPLYGPLTQLLPPLRALRFPSKAMLAAALIVAVLAGLGLRALRGASRAGLACSAAVLLATTGMAAVAARVDASLGASPWLGVAFAALVPLLRGPRLEPRVASALLIALVSCDLVVAHRDLNATLPASLLLERPAVLSSLVPEDGARVHVWDYTTQPEASQRLLGRGDPYQPAAGPTGLDARVLAFAAQRQLLAPLTANFFGVETSYDFDRRGLDPRELNDLTYFLDYVQGTTVHARLLRLGAVSRVVALHDPGEAELRLARALPSLAGEALRVFEVEGALPRARLVGRTRVAEGAAAFHALAEPSFDPAVEAVVESGRPLETPALEGSGRWLERRPDRLRLETTSTGDGLLVLADAYDPGWRATVDGARAPVLRANVAFRGVALKAGRHTVELLYRPPSVVFGLSVSLAALAATVLLVVRDRARASSTPSARPLTPSASSSRGGR